MLKLRKFIVLFILLLFTLNIKSFATTVNMNSSIENNPIADNTIDVNDDEILENDDLILEDNETSNLVTHLDTNTTANIQSLDRIDYTTSSFNASNIINILLIAVGLVIILLAIAILIRLRK